MWLPVVNRRAVDWAMRASMALNMDIATNSKFDRKTISIQIIQKAYQISQFDQPIGENGYIDIEVDGETNVSVLHVFTWKKMQVNQHIKMDIL